MRRVAGIAIIVVSVLIGLAGAAVLYLAWQQARAIKR